MLNKKEYDLVIVGNGTASAGIIHALKKYNFEYDVLVIEKQSIEEIRNEIPEYLARVTFGETIDKFGLESAIINPPGYSTVSFFAPKQTARFFYSPTGKSRSVLLDVRKTIDILESNLPNNFEIVNGVMVNNAKYIYSSNNFKTKLPLRKTNHGKSIELSLGPSSGAVGLEEKIIANLVIDCSGTSAVVFESITDSKRESKVYCGVLAAKVINANLFNPINKNSIVNRQDIPLTEKLFAYNDVSIAQDWTVSRGAGAWAYNNGLNLSQELREYIGNWLKYENDSRVKKLLKNKSVDDLMGTISDIGISSIVPYSTTSKEELEWRLSAFFSKHNTYTQWFSNNWIIIPGSKLWKNSPVLQPIDQMSFDNLMIVGDSAGHATPYIGEGIRPSLDLGYAAGKIAIEAFVDTDFSEKKLMRLENVWWENFGKNDIWSNAFRHLSSNSFKNKDWDIMFKNVKENLSAEEFFEVLKSNYDRGIVWKMLSTKMFLTYMTHSITQFKSIYKKLNLRAMDSWFR